jgi:hypothetical protein
MKRTCVLVCILLISTTALAQTRARRTTKSSQSKTSKASAEQAANAAAKADGATKVANQIKNLSRFLYLLGGVARGIEDLDRAAKSGGGSPTVLAQNEKNKATLISSFADFRAGLDQLELTFRNTPALQGYYVKMAGSASGAADAETQAGQGHFDQAGRTLLGVLNRLTDVLVSMQ